MSGYYYRGDFMIYSQKAINEYQKRNYYRVNVTFPVEYREEIQKAAKLKGVSVSRLITDLVGAGLGLDLALDGQLPGVKGKE